MNDDDIIEMALAVLEKRMQYKADVLSGPGDVRNFLRLRLGGLEHEEFYCVWLDARNAVIAVERLFRGTLTQTSVYPREVVKLALKHNAAAVILAHNHPSGSTAASDADLRLTGTLKTALGLVDVRVLDHLIITANEPAWSFAERGLI
jgi:DNA repair protein RadC